MVVRGAPHSLAKQLFSSKLFKNLGDGLVVSEWRLVKYYPPRAGSLTGLSTSFPARALFSALNFFLPASFYISLCSFPHSMLLF